MKINSRSDLCEFIHNTVGCNDRLCDNCVIDNINCSIKGELTVPCDHEWKYRTTKSGIVRECTKCNEAYFKHTIDCNVNKLNNLFDN